MAWLGESFRVVTRLDYRTLCAQRLLAFAEKCREIEYRPIKSFALGVLNNISRDVLQIRIVTNVRQLSWAKKPFDNAGHINVEQRLRLIVTER